MIAGRSPGRPGSMGRRSHRAARSAGSSADAGSGSGGASRRSRSTVSNQQPQPPASACAPSGRAPLRSRGRSGRGLAMRSCRQRSGADSVTGAFSPMRPASHAASARMQSRRAWARPRARRGPSWTAPRPTPARGAGPVQLGPAVHHHEGGIARGEPPGRLFEPQKIDAPLHLLAATRPGRRPPHPRTGSSGPLRGQRRHAGGQVRGPQCAGVDQGDLRRSWATRAAASGVACGGGPLTRDLHPQRAGHPVQLLDGSSAPA